MMRGWVFHSVSDQIGSLVSGKKDFAFWRPYLEAVLLLIAGCVMFYTAAFNGQVFDEIAHINTGLAFWSDGNPNLDPVHPPLRVFLGLPAYWLRVPTPTLLDDPVTIQHTTGVLLGARMIMIMTFLAWSWFFGRLTGRWLGKSVGVASLAIILFEPTMIGHATLATTDILLMMTCFLTTAAVFEWVKKPGWIVSILIGGAMGLTMLAKFNSALWFIGLLAGMVIYWVMKGRPIAEDRRFFYISALQVVVALSIAWVLFCLPYRFDGIGTPFEKMNLGHSKLGDALMSVGKVPSPVPSPVLEGMDDLLGSVNNRFFYFHGKAQVGEPFPLYFPAALLFKLPLAMLALLLMALWGGIHQKKLFNPEIWIFIIPPAFFFLMIAFVFDMQIGIRHISPIFPFLAIAAAWVTVSYSAVLWRVIAWGAVLSIVILGVNLAPHQLAYFNKLIGGPKYGWHWFIDSNQDWGQGSPALWEYLDRKKRYCCFSPVEGETTGWICVETNVLVGFNMEDHEKFRWLREDFKVKKFLEPCWVFYKIDKDHWENTQAEE